MKTLLFAGVVILGAVTMVAGAPQGPTTGFATAIYHSKADSKVLVGREIQCKLQNSSAGEANDCAMAWCQVWAKDKEKGPTTCKEEKTVDATAKGDITQVDPMVMYYNKKKGE